MVAGVCLNSVARLSNVPEHYRNCVCVSCCTMLDSLLFTGENASLARAEKLQLGGGEHLDACG